MTDRLTIRIKQLDPQLPVPAYARPGDAGMDLFAAEPVRLEPGERALVATGIAIGVPLLQFYGLTLEPRQAAERGVGEEQLHVLVRGALLRPAGVDGVELLAAEGQAHEVRGEPAGGHHGEDGLGPGHAGLLGSGRGLRGRASPTLPRRGGLAHVSVMFSAASGSAEPGPPVVLGQQRSRAGRGRGGAARP